MMNVRLLITIAFLAWSGLSWGQGKVSLQDCQQWARDVHPLLKQQELYQQITALKLDNIQTAYLPQIDLNAQASYQSDVTYVGAAIPGIDFPQVSKDQYKAYLDVQQNIWDGGVSKARNELEQAQEQTNLQGVEVELYQVKEQVNGLFFSSFLIQQNLALLDKKEETLQAQKTQLAAALENGSVLQSDLDQVLAELVRIRQQKIALKSQRGRSLTALAILTGRTTAELEKLAIETDDQIVSVENSRPELTLFQRQSEQLAASAELSQKARNPKFYGFGQAGYGRPALNMLNDDFDTYYLVGLGINWTVFDWKKTKRERELLDLQRELVQTQQTEFERNISLALNEQEHQIEQAQELLKSDEELIELQASISKSSASKLENGTITTADYLQDLNAEMAARINFELHKVQLQAARESYRTILGQ